MGRSSDIAAAYDVRAVTASANPLPNGSCRSIYLASSGDVTGIPAGGSTSVTFTAAPAGILPVQFRIISACPANTLALY